MNKPQCQKCKTSNVIFRCQMAICESCGYEITLDRFFANAMANAILAQECDGMDRTGWLVATAQAFLSASNNPDDDFQNDTIDLLR